MKCAANIVTMACRIARSPVQSATVSSDLARSSRSAAVTATLLNGGTAAVVADTVSPPAVVVITAFVRVRLDVRVDLVERERQADGDADTGGAAGADRERHGACDGVDERGVQSLDRRARRRDPVRACAVHVGLRGREDRVLGVRACARDADAGAAQTAADAAATAMTRASMVWKPVAFTRKRLLPRIDVPV
jgi:hypothetical protein